VKIILAVSAFLLLHTSPPVPRQAPSARNQDAHQQEAAPKKEQHPSAVPNSDTPENATNQNQHCEDHSSKNEIISPSACGGGGSPIDLFVGIAQIILAVVGMGGVVIGLCTLRTLVNQTHYIKKQAIATKIAAEASGRNAEALVNHTRPWVLIALHDGEQNKGRAIIKAS
jgi:hypothetical protein